jgi:ribosomal protein S18 acetylase RimI-like enzyme
MLPDRVLVRPATAEDADAVVELLLHLPGGLVEVLGDRTAARRVARVTFRSRRSLFSARRTFVADEGGRVVGLMVVVGPDDWARGRIPTGFAMLRGAGPRRAWRVVWRGPLEERLVPPIPSDASHVVALSVVPDRRGSGIGSELLRHAVRVASAWGHRRVTLDVGARNVGAIRLYQRQGFLTVSEQHRPAMRGWPAATSFRMERAAE